MNEKMDILKKLGSIDLPGNEKISGNKVEVFTGFDESLRKRANVALKFDEISEKAVKDEIIDVLENLEKKYDMNYSLVGRDFPIHSTLLEGLSSDKEMDPAKKYLDLSSLNEKNLDYKYVITNGRDIMLAADTIPEFIIDARDELANEYEKLGLRPLGMDNMLHITLARATSLPSAENMDEYKKDIRELLRKKISASPLHLKMAKAYQGTAFDLLNPKKE